MTTKVIFAGKYTAETVGSFNDWAVISIGEPDASTPNIKEGW